MSAAARLAGFAALLAALFAGAALAGAAIGPQAPEADAEPEPRHGAGHEGSAAAATHPVRGLAVAEDGLRLVVDRPELPRGRSARLTYRIVDEQGATVRDFDVEHERRMHLILARRDLTGFQHLHPEQAGDGSWSVPVTLGRAGSYRLFADFSRAGRPVTLASDLRVDGSADLEPLPAPATTATTSGYDVRLDAGRELRFTVARGGETVRTEPYLGAGGHLVALREGDLAFLHVHPTGHGDAIGFAATFPTAGRYRLFLQFQHEGRVHTAAFTREVG